MVDDIRGKVGEPNRTKKEELAELFNTATLKSIKQYIKGVNDGSIVVENVSDMARLVNIYAELNDISYGEGSGEGVLPPVPETQLSYLGDAKEEKTVVDEDGNISTESVVDLNDIAQLSDEAYEELLNKRADELNVQNEKERLGIFE